MAAIKHLFHINASKETVFKAISTIDGLRQWWTINTNGNDNIDGIIKFRFINNIGMDLKVITIKYPEFYQWKCTDAHPEWIDTIITFKLSENNGKTLVDFEHNSWADQTEYYAHCNFSWGRYLISLRDYCEQGKGNPYSNN